LEALAIIPFFMFSYVIGNMTFACYQMDFMCLLGMYFIYKLNEASKSRSSESN